MCMGCFCIVGGGFFGGRHDVQLRFWLRVQRGWGMKVVWEGVEEVWDFEKEVGIEVKPGAFM